jgi:hypothetical protein
LASRSEPLELTHALAVVWTMAGAMTVAIATPDAAPSTTVAAPAAASTFISRY